MQKTNRELAEFYGIEVGDTIKVFKEDGDVWGIFLVGDLDAMCPLKVGYHIEGQVAAMDIYHIGKRRYEIIKPKKKLGETCCCDYMHCSKCPLCVLNCNCVAKDDRWSLYRLLNEVCYCYGMKSDNPIYLALRAELDKEVE